MKRRKGEQAWGRWEERGPVYARVVGVEPPPDLITAYLNAIYSVQVYGMACTDGVLAGNSVVHLIIRRHDGGTDVPWQHKQRIKNELVGSERVAFEVFPPADVLVDQCNLYHLWVLPAGVQLGVGLHQGGVLKGV